MKGRMDLSVACECGTTLRISSLDANEVDDYRNRFDTEHRFHQRVSTDDARRIREHDPVRRNRSGRK